MKQFLSLTFTLIFIATSLSAQIKSHLKDLKTERNIPLQATDLQPVQRFDIDVPKVYHPFNQLPSRQFQSLPVLSKQPQLKVVMDTHSNLPIFIKGKVKDLPEGDVTMQSYAFLEMIKNTLQIETPSEEFDIKTIQTDALGQTHVRLQQTFQSIPIYGSEVVVHFENGVPHLLNGRYFPTPDVPQLNPNIVKTTAQNIVLEHLGSHAKIKTLSAIDKQLVQGEQVEATLVIYHADGNIEAEKLAWQLTAIPNITARWTYFIDALTGEILTFYNQICQIEGHNHQGVCTKKSKPKSPMSHALGMNEITPPPDGPATANAVDLLGITRTINTYEEGNTFFLIDASRAMHNITQSNFPNDPIGVIWTIDGLNNSPANNNFEATQIFSNNNSWNNPTAVSAHFNGGEAYKYFKNTFNRESINGQGGNIVSIINISDENGDDMDNAFWNGAAMFYGNGNQAFTAPLAKALDVAGHEMAHGVVQSTANLEYLGESGALNESFADIFGAMIDRDDWKMGEDVVNANVFTSGALRDLSNPHNGGTGLNSPGWQPDHTSEQFTGSQDNGGVHINSGIPNHAFFQFAEDIGKDKAEQVFYRALNNYLVKSSQFIDLRLAVVQAATDLHGANSTEVNAAKSAFDAVGIFNGTGTNTQEDIELNPGDDFILTTNVNETGLFIFAPDGTVISNPLTTVAPLSRPSVTDDGSRIVYIAEDQTMQEIVIDWGGGSAVQNTIQSDPMWRNVAIARDGSRIAALTDDLDNRVWIFDFGKNEWVIFDLFNPTTAQGGATTGDVVFADILEFDFTGEWVMYDALNRIESTSGADIEYWDVGFLRVYDNASNDWGDNFISKLFSGLSENTSVGNPTFSKNSDFIIAFDFIDDFNQEFSLLAANTETGDVGTIFENITLSIPNYSIDDQQMVFDAENNLGNPVLAFIPLADDKISSTGDGIIFLDDMTKGVWFANGERDLTSVVEISEGTAIHVFPNPIQETVTLEIELEKAAAIEIQIINAFGTILQTATFELQQGMNRPTLQVDDLSAGVYWLQVQIGGARKTVQVVKF